MAHYRAPQDFLGQAGAAKVYAVLEIVCAPNHCQSTGDLRLEVVS